MRSEGGYVTIGTAFTIPVEKVPDLIKQLERVHCGQIQVRKFDSGEVVEAITGELTYEEACIWYNRNENIVDTRLKDQSVGIFWRGLLLG